MKGDGVSDNNETPARKGFHPIDGMRDWWADAPHWQRYGVYLALIVLVLILPAPWIGSFMSPYSDWTTVLIFPVGTYILLAVGLNIVVGHAGLLDLGFVAFFAIGAYTWRRSALRTAGRTGRRWCSASSWRRSRGSSSALRHCGYGVTTSRS